jgi:rare lipoprotein A
MNAEEAWYHDHYNQVAALEVQHGKATYYGEELAGNKTASGELFEPRRFTAAHRRLPFGTVVRVVRLDTGAHTYVRINDRGPFGDERRIIDLAKVAAGRLEMLRAGVVEVRVEILRWGEGRRSPVARR